MNANLKTGLIVAGVGVLVYFAWRAWRSSPQGAAPSAVGSGRAAFQVPGGKRLDPIGPNLIDNWSLIDDAHLDPSLLLDCPGCGPEHPPLMDGLHEERPTGLLTGGEDPGTGGGVDNPSLGKFMTSPLAWQSV